MSCTPRGWKFDSWSIVDQWSWLAEDLTGARPCGHFQPQKLTAMQRGGRGGRRRLHRGDVGRPGNGIWQHHKGEWQWLLDLIGAMLWRGRERAESVRSFGGARASFFRVSGLGRRGGPVAE
jgi:hypothetical protein